MRVVSFNVHHGTVGRRGPVDPQRLAEVCAGFEADVIALQEVDQHTRRVGGADLAAVAAARCDMDHVFGPSRRLPGGRYGNAVLVAGTVTASRVLPLPRVPRTHLWQEQRTVLDVTAQVRGRTIRVAATHLAVPEAVNGPQLGALLDRVAGEAGPLVVLGDLNRRAERVQPLADEAGLALVDHGPTFPATGPDRSIDHVLVSPGVRVLAAEVRPTPMSDHAALVVDLEVPAR